MRYTRVFMYRRKCDYELVGLGAGPCPECGRAFAPDDDSTFFRVTRRERAAKRCGIIILALATSPWIASTLAHLSLVVARLSLGRWPNRWGRVDDPTEIAGVVWVYYPAMVAMIAIPMSLLISTILSYWVWRGRSWGGIARVFFPATIVFALGWALLAFDPADVWFWIMD